MKFNKKSIAKILSTVLNPYIISIIVQIILYIYFIDTISHKEMALIILLLESTAPFSLALIFKKLKLISDLDITERKERPLYFATLIIIITVLTIILNQYLKTNILLIPILSLNLALIIATGISIFWKISGHLTFGTILFLSLGLINPTILYILILLPPLAWSRVVLKKHTINQTLAGTLLGFLIFTTLLTTFNFIDSQNKIEPPKNKSVQINKDENTIEESSNEDMINLSDQDNKPENTIETEPQNPEYTNLWIPNKKTWWEYPDEIKTITDNPDENLTLLVNKEYKLPVDYKPKDLTNLGETGIKYSSQKNGRKIIIQPLKELNEAAKNDGIDLAIKSAYRSYTTQQSTYSYWVSKEGGDNSKADRYSARAGHSEHQLGTTIDFTSPESNYNIGSVFHNTKAAKWLEKNAWRYGFILSYPKGKEHITGYTYESWHYRFVGKDIAKVLYEEDLCLIEYYAL